MTPKKHPKTISKAGSTPVRDQIRCRRVEAMYSPEEHATCPYCFGRVSDIKTGDHTRFCDFKPGEDPICFGFPPDHGRYAH